ncbi:hypothetical protein PPE_05860 [Paenibacillus polymyxa E681]|nr:hypothetical protein PPE_05860 [Paenibacillus polymyxa E681]
MIFRTRKWEKDDESIEQDTNVSANKKSVAPYLLGLNGGESERTFVRIVRSNDNDRNEFRIG